MQKNVRFLPWSYPQRSKMGGPSSYPAQQGNKPTRKSKSKYDTNKNFGAKKCPFPSPIVDILPHGSRVAQLTMQCRPTHPTWWRCISWTTQYVRARHKTMILSSCAAHKLNINARSWHLSYSYPLFLARCFVGHPCSPNETFELHIRPPDLWTHCRREFEVD